MKKVLKWTLIFIISCGTFIFLAFKLSPYPTIWIVRYAFNQEADRVNSELEKFVSPSVETIPNIHYDEEDPDAFLDVYFHRDSVKVKGNLPIIVWTHGGGLISGNKNQVGNYCKILASHGYVVASIDYTIAPEGKYPTPIIQLNNALAFLSSNAEKFHADSSIFFLAGDSGGSMIAASTANVIKNSSYADLTKVLPGLDSNQLKGLLLYCGIYDIDNLNTEGNFGAFLKATVWAYFGKKDISDDAYAKTASVTNFLTGSFPPVFISAGNNDPLLSQSHLLKDKLSSLGVPVDTLFYPDNLEPVLGHEYQFKMDEVGKAALNRSLKFLDTLCK